MMRRIIAVDPGKATGVAVFDFETGQEPILVWSGEVDEIEFPDAVSKPVYERMHMVSGKLDREIQYVCESFTITADTAKKTQAPFSLELIGVLKYLARTQSERHTPEGSVHPQIVMQKPGDAKSVFPNDKLKKLGYWHVGGAGHANDAIRHGLLYLAKNGWTPARLLD